MKLKIVLVLVLVWVGQSAFGQAYETKNKLEDNNNQKELTVNQAENKSITSISKSDQLSMINDVYFSDKEWEKTKRQIRRNRKRIVSSRNGIHTTKKLDTIYLEIKIPTNNSRITDW
ncbi:hypothetical protein ACWGOQ_0003080 [Aquimarina sp. M1]